jgi:1-phosphatidylinositol-4-phosphate 5-kinase
MQSDLPRDEIQLDEDARRWTEAVRHKRASKRRRKEEEIDDDRVLVGTRVDENHTNWVTAYNMLTGIRVSVSRNNAKVDRVLTNDDFTSKQKSTFDM